MISSLMLLSTLATTEARAAQLFVAPARNDTNPGKYHCATIQVSDDPGVAIPWHKVAATEITHLLPDDKTMIFARLVVTQEPYTGP
ncbi:MAG: hypothetical protein NTW21_02765 [Verrucomicrobia bacterium]|nr:hypothetical protein [Verrucomicrobiota bacterium]